jgi:hypothetical protein
MIKTLRFFTFSLLLAIIISSCGKSNKESQGNLGGSVDDASNYAKSKYGESVTLVYLPAQAGKGDINANKKDDALALVINKKFGDTRYWIQKGSIIEKDGGEWKTILWMEEKLKSTKGELIRQVDAKNGYIISFDTSKSPVNLYISMADENGRPASDEAIIKWNSKDSIYELSTGSSESSTR